MWILIDNYDSFTYMLHHYLLELQHDVKVVRNDAVRLEELIALHPERLIISPGPQTPQQAGITNAAIGYFIGKIPILGICLGHQALGIYLGGTLSKALKPVHGNTSVITHSGKGLFDGIPQSFKAMRYHSLVIKNWENAELEPLAFSEEKELMAFKHKVFQATGIQFHPESILTEHGLQLLRNWDHGCQ
jgi:anthranilate synthase/aminodeoxychorismate synthase-like glutamine amidotransferase